MRDGLNLIVAQGASARGPLRSARIHKLCIKYVWSPVIGLHLTFAFLFCRIVFLATRSCTAASLFTADYVFFKRFFVLFCFYEVMQHMCKQACDVDARV